MSAPSPLPSLSQLRGWDTEHLTAAADRWTATAARWERTFSSVSDEMREPGGTPWFGEAAEAAQQRAYADRLKVVGVADRLHTSADAARSAARELESAKQRVLSAVAQARAAGFTVREDLSVTAARGVGWHAGRSAGERFAAEIRERAATLAALDRQAAGRIFAAGGGIGGVGFDEPRDGGPGDDGRGTRALDGKESPPAPPQPGDPIDPGDLFVDDPRFGHWENVPPLPPHTGTIPPLKPEYRPYPAGTPLKVGPTTAMYTPGKSWAADADAPAVQAQEEYRFRLAGTEATTTTRMAHEDGRWQQQRWVRNVYEYQRNTSKVFGGDIGRRQLDGTGGDIAGTPQILRIDTEWKPISFPEIAAQSARNADVTYYLPDGCGGTVTYVGGVPMSPSLPPSPPIMTRPR
jgi:hypothetical protein